MISYERDPQQAIPESSVKIIGLGGAGANMLARTALDGMVDAEMMCVNTDMRTLSSSVVGEKIQIGRNLTKGLGAGGDPDLGLRAAQESELELRDAMRERKMIFLCVGLGGGTGSGAAPLLCRLAREEGAFVVVFATMPFSFEGTRRREQAEKALNEIAVLSNALVTFDNGRMGELVLAKQGIHEAFVAADRIVSESIKAVTRLVVKPGLINVGLDDLMSALKTTRSRCLFGSGIAKGENRSQSALENALNSPLLDKGSLLEDATTILVHICGGESLTLHEVELLMSGLSKYVPASAHVLFGAAVDPVMDDSISVTIVSALPEGILNPTRPESSGPTEKNSESELDKGKDKAAITAAADLTAAAAATALVVEDDLELEISEDEAGETNLESENTKVDDESFITAQKDPVDEPTIDGPFAAVASEPDSVQKVDFIDNSEDEDEDQPEGDASWLTEPVAEPELGRENLSEVSDSFENDIADSAGSEDEEVKECPPTSAIPVTPAQSELELDGGPRGKFEGGSPNFHEGEDLDIPPFLRKKRR